MNDKTENLQQDDFNQVAWFDENVRPLVSQVYKLCQENDIPFVAAFSFALDTDLDGDKRHQRFHMGGSCHLPANSRVPCEMRVAQTLMFEGFSAATPTFLSHITAEACGDRESYTERGGEEESASSAVH